jgi:hypothetical protein
MVGRRGEAPAGPTLQVPPYGSLACRIGAPIYLSRLCGPASDAPATLFRCYKQPYGLTGIFRLVGVGF